jgi:hypothetical protein
MRTCVISAALVLALSGTAAADVTGKVSLTGTAGRPELRGKGFLERTENPFLGGRMFDPMPHLVVVLIGDGLPVPPTPQIKWKLLGESFEKPVLPVIAGTEVVIRNEGRRSPSLYIEGDEDLLPKTPLNPKGERAFKAGDPGTVHEVRDGDTPHLAGAVVVMPTAYFATPGKDGSFAIKTAGLPDGSYTIKVWYKTGWIDGVAEAVQLDDEKAKKDITLPPGLKLAAP